MGILKLPQLLLIAGNGRDSGKTTLACLFIEKFSPEHRIFALKISPFKHRITGSGKVLCDTESLYIAEETNPGTGKDSSRMLRAGACRAFFICSAEDQLSVAINTILKLSDDRTLLVCESGELRRIAEPGLFCIVYRLGSGETKLSTQNLLKFQNIGVTFDGRTFNLNLNEIVIQYNSWKKIAGHDIV